MKPNNEDGVNDGEDESVSSEESDDDDLVLEGVVVRDPDVSDEEDDDDNEDDDETADKDSDEDRQEESPEGFVGKDVQQRITAEAEVKRKTRVEKQDIAPKRKKRRPSSDTLNVEFTFCDMDEKYFHGLKILLHSSSPVYQEHSSALADLMVENVAVGTIVGTSQEDSTEADVFGFASVLNVSTNETSPSIQFLKTFCLGKCPPEHKNELDIVLSGRTKRPVGFLLHGRMINMPLEIVHVLHQQLVLDMDWAVDNAGDDESERKSLDFGAFVRLAPCQKDGRSIIYKYFDDEVFAQHAEFAFTADSPKPAQSQGGMELVNVMVLTKTGHREAMGDLSKLINGN